MIAISPLYDMLQRLLLTRDDRKSDGRLIRQNAVRNLHLTGPGVANTQSLLRLRYCGFVDEFHFMYRNDQVGNVIHPDYAFISLH
jgi:hypothetical protein